MGFPGRLNEKKKKSVLFWVGLVGGGLLVLWMIVGIVRTINQPLTKEQTKQIYTKPADGYVKQKADAFNDDINQIAHGDPFKHAPPKKNSGRAVTYEADKGNGSYYGGGNGQADSSGAK